VRIPTPAAVLWDTLSRAGDEWSGASQGRIARSSLGGITFIASHREKERCCSAVGSATCGRLSPKERLNLNELARLEAPRPELLDGLEPLERVERLRELLVPAPRGSPPMPLKHTKRRYQPFGRVGGRVDHC
jgi:hypothetical protein